jgi:hypothetical protein
MALPTLPSGWANYTPQQKISWFNANGVTTADLASAGVPQSDIDWMLDNGYSPPAPVVAKPIQQEPVRTQPEPTYQEPVYYEPEPVYTASSAPAPAPAVAPTSTSAPTYNVFGLQWDSSAPLSTKQGYVQTLLNSGITSDQIKAKIAELDPASATQSTYDLLGIPKATPSTPTPTSTSTPTPTPTSTSTSTSTSTATPAGTSTPAVDTSSAVDKLNAFLDQAASNTGIYEGKQDLQDKIADLVKSTSVTDKATVYNQLNDNYSDNQIKSAIATVTGKPVTDTDWNYLTGAAKVQEVAQNPKTTLQQKAELYNDLQELFPTQSNQFINDLINTVAPGQKAEDLKYLAAASDVQDVASGTVQDKAKVYNNLISQGYDAATATNIIKDATGQAPTAKDMGYLTDAAKVQSLATSTDPNAKADFYNELLKRYDPTAIGNLFTDALGKQQSASDMKYLMELAQQRQTAATTAQTELQKQQAADKAAADRQKAALDAATQAQEAARKAAAGSTFNTGITYGTGMGADRKGTGVDISGESGLRGAYAPYVERMLERASAEADVPFQKYTGSSPLLESARAGIANLTTPAQFLQGSNLAQAAGIGALDYGKYKPTSFTTGTFANPNFASQLSPADLKNQAALKPPGFVDGGAVGVGSANQQSIPSMPVPTNPNLQPTTYGGQGITNVQASYMSPYMQGAVDPAIKEAKRQAEIANQAIGAKAAQAGAFGGSRQGLMESELQRNLLNQIGTIQGQGLQKAYESGLGQFNTEQQRALEAQKMGEQSRQFGAELGLKGLQTGIQAGSALGNLGQQQGYLDLATLKQMADLGQQQQQFDYNEFLRGEKYPYENLTFMRNMLQGLPYNAAPTGIDPMSQALSGGISSVYLAQLLGGLGG